MPNRQELVQGCRKLLPPRSENPGVQSSARSLPVLPLFTQSGVFFTVAAESARHGAKSTKSDAKRPWQTITTSALHMGQLLLSEMTSFMQLLQSKECWQGQVAVVTRSVMQIKHSLRGISSSEGVTCTSCKLSELTSFRAEAKATEAASSARATLAQSTFCKIFTRPDKK
mmetsp:Transcript_11237/g.19936  ORF Transcript_11237/g.19936 Transcript_11237/m.19936 type:complete len:170 (+) Transcript_11237:136-645(+)